MRKSRNSYKPVQEYRQLQDAPSLETGLSLLTGLEAVRQNLASDRLCEMLKFYETLWTAANGMPPISMYEMAALPEHLPTLAIIEPEYVADAVFDYRYRMFGTALSLMFGEEMTGRRVSDFSDSSRVARARYIYDAVLSKRQPLLSVGDFDSRNGVPVSGEALALPFGKNGRVTHILVEMDYDTQV
jgi:hypothetical protein